MRILGINSATSLTSVCVVENAVKKTAKTTTGTAKLPPTPTTAPSSTREKANTLYEKTWESDRDEAEKILPAVKTALKKGKPDLIFVVRGPGSFTGLRIGVTIANMLAFVFNVKVAAVDTFDYLRARAGKDRKTKTAVILKAGGEFAAVLLPGEKTPARLQKSQLGTFLKKNRSIVFAVGDMSRDERKSFILPVGVKWLSERELAGLPDVIGPNVAAGKIRPQKMAVPKYLRPPKITKSKKPVFTGARC